MRLSYLNAFVKVIKHQSITKAGEELYLSQPAITKQMKLLEEYYGVTLIQRQDKKIIPTSEGKKLYASSLRLLGETNELLCNFKNEVDDCTGKVDLISSNFPANYILPKLLGEFSSLYKNISYSIQTTNSQDVFNNVIDGIQPFGFVGIEKNAPNIESIKIFESNMVLVGVKRRFINLLKYPDRIKNQNFILRTAGSATLMEIKNHFNNLNIEKINTSVECNSNETVKKLILAGMGIGYCFENEIQEYIDNGTLIILDENKITRKFYYIYNINRYKSIPENTFHKYMIKKYANLA